MALLCKITRSAKGARNPLLNYKTEQEPLCSFSSCCSNDNKPPPLIGCDNPSDPTTYDVSYVSI